VVLKNNENVTLTVAHFNKLESGDIEDEAPNTIIKFYELLYPKAVFKLIEVNGTFARAPGLQQAADEFEDTSLLFFLDVDVIFGPNVIQKVRFNTIRGRQVIYNHAF